MTQRLRVHPPGPYPPHGHEAEGEVDLGIRMRDLLFTRHAVTGWGRRALAERLSIVARDPMRLAMASGWIDDLPMTWPLGALVEDARESWTAGPDGDALAVLLKASQVLAPVLGWPTSIDRRWPMPDPEWVKGQVGEKPVVMVPRGRGDGTTGLSIVLDAEVEPRPLGDDGVLAVGIDEIEHETDRILAALASGAKAIQITTPGPTTEAQHDAWLKVRAAGARQQSYDRGGRAGLLVDRVPRFQDLLGDAPSGRMGETLEVTCDVLLLPALEEGGKVGLVGVLAWDGPYHPVRVVPGAAEVLRHLDGETTLGELAEALHIDRGTLEAVAEQLVGIGAATAVGS